MNLTFKLIISFFIFSQTCIAQDTTKAVNDAWANLKTQLQRRTDIVNNIANVLAKSKQVDQMELTKAKGLAVDLFKYTDTLKTLDSLSIFYVNALNTDLTQALARTLVTLERDQKLRSSASVQDLLVQLEGIENRIMVAKMDYNDICSDNNKKELFFGNNTKAKPPEVKF